MAGHPPQPSLILFLRLLSTMPIAAGLWWQVIPHEVLDKAALLLDRDAALMVRDSLSARGDTDDTFGGNGGRCVENPARSLRGNGGDAECSLRAGGVACGHRHLEQGLPRNAAYSFPEILCNPLIEQCVLAFLGPAAVRYWSVHPRHYDSLSPRTLFRSPPLFPTACP